MYNILVTGVGAIIGYGIVKSFKELPHLVKNVYGIDIYSYAVGQKWCDGFTSICRTDSPHYPEQLKDIIQKWKIDLIIPGIEQDAQFWAENIHLLNQTSVKVVLNDRTLIELSKDKWALIEFLRNNALLCIESSLSSNYQELVKQLGLPFLVKPRRSYASKGLKIIHSTEQFAQVSPKMGEVYLAQKIIGTDDHEYTASVFGYGDGTVSKSIIFQRYLHLTGATERATIIKSDAIDQSIAELSRLLKPIGPTNFQYRYENGEYYLLEINPRFSSSHSLKEKFGFPEAEMTAKFYLEGQKGDNINIKCRPNFRIRDSSRD